MVLINSLPVGNAPNSCLLFKIDKFFNCNMILKKYDYFRIENVMFMMDNYNINTVYEKYMQLNKKERKRLLDSLHIHGIDIKKIEPYVYSEAPGIKHLFVSTQFRASPFERALLSALNRVLLIN